MLLPRETGFHCIVIFILQPFFIPSFYFDSLCIASREETNLITINYE